MSSSQDFPTIYTKYPHYYLNECPLCKNPVKFCYPGRKRIHRTLEGPFYEVRYLYLCTNPQCKNSNKKFNPSPKYSFSQKRYTKGAWKFIATEAKVYKQTTSQIQCRILNQYGIKIAENTIKSYVDEVDLYLANRIDKKTEQIVKSQGKIILSLDGQEPDGEGSALWLFVDIISNRVLSVKILNTADNGTLHDIVEEILKKYEVKLAGILSDKQQNITKMRDTFYPDVPHQYCQFHYLSNLWGHLQTKDRHMHGILSKMVKTLYICTVSKDFMCKIDGVGRVKIREFFKDLESDLRKIMKGRTKKFSNLRGIEAYEKFGAYVNDIDDVLSIKDATLRVSKILKKTSISIHNSLDDCKNIYEDCLELRSIFRNTQNILNSDSMGKEKHQDQLKIYFKKLWSKYRGYDGVKIKKELRAFLPKVKSSKYQIVQEWVRLYDRYNRGLFAYYDFPVQERTNSKMEQQFSQEKYDLRGKAARAKVSSQIRIKGEYILKQNYAGKEEILEYIEEISKSYSHDDIEEGLRDLAERRYGESKNWRNKLGGLSIIEELFKKNGT